MRQISQCDSHHPVTLCLFHASLTTTTTTKHGWAPWISVLQGTALPWIPKANGTASPTASWAACDQFSQPSIYGTFTNDLIWLMFIVFLCFSINIMLLKILGNNFWSWWQGLKTLLASDPIAIEIFMPQELCHHSLFLCHLHLSMRVTLCTPKHINSRLGQQSNYVSFTLFHHEMMNRHESATLPTCIRLMARCKGHAAGLEAIKCLRLRRLSWWKNHHFTGLRGNRTYNF